MDAALYTGSSGAVGPAPTRREQAYDALKTRLLVGDFPLHRRLAEERLAAMLGVSRTPVREALLRLHAEGLVERLPDGGWGPTAPDVDAVHDLYEIRLGLELMALRRPADPERACTHDPAVLEPLRDEWRDLSDQEPEPDPDFVLLDEDFHVRLAASSGNASLADLLGSVNERIRTVRMHDFLTAERVRRTVEQHLGIVETVLAGDLPLAVERLGGHLGESMAVVEDRAMRALARMASGKGGMRS